MSNMNEILHKQLNQIFAELRGGYGIHWSLNQVLHHVNQTIIGDYHTDFNGLETFKKLHKANDSFGKKIIDFTDHTENFLEGLQNKLKETQNIIFSLIPPPLPDLTNYSREQLYFEIINTYIELKDKLNYGYWLLTTIKGNINPPEPNEVLLFLQKTLRFIGDNFYKGQIIVRSLFEPYIVHLLLWLGVETALGFFSGYTRKGIDAFAGKGNLIPNTTIIWNGIKDQDVLPVFLKALRSSNTVSNYVLELSRKIPDVLQETSSTSLNPFNSFYEHRVPVDPDWLPKFETQIKLCFDPEDPLFLKSLALYFGKDNSIIIGTYLNEKGYQLPGAKNIWDALENVRTPIRSLPEEINHQNRLRTYQDVLYGQWLMEIRALGNRFYNLMTQAIPLLEQSIQDRMAKDIPEQVACLDHIKKTYQYLEHHNKITCLQNKKLEEDERIPKGPASEVPPSPFPYAPQDFITDYIRRLDKGLVGFKTPLSKACDSYNSVGYSYHTLKKKFQEFYNPLEEQVNAKNKTFEPTKVNTFSLDQLFETAQKFAKEKGVRDLYKQYKLTKQLDD